MLKKLVKLLIVVSMLTACSSAVDEPCMYCHQSPSKEYKKNDGTLVYVCEDCSSVCMICGDNKATKQYESLLGIMFVCDDCFEAVQ